MFARRVYLGEHPALKTALGLRDGFLRFLARHSRKNAALSALSPVLATSAANIKH